MGPFSFPCYGWLYGATFVWVGIHGDISTIKKEEKKVPGGLRHISSPCCPAVVHLELCCPPIVVVVVGGGGGDMATLVAVGPLVVVVAVALGPSFDVVALPVTYLIVYKLYIH